MADAPRTVMLTISQIAERDGVSKPTVSQKVGELVAKHGLTVERDTRGRVCTVNVAEYDHLRGRFGDPSKAQAPAAPSLPIDKTESYDEALRQKTWHEAERKKIELAQLRGDLVPVAEVSAAVSRIAEDLVRIVDRLPAQADDIAAAVAREGAHGARTALKKLAQKMRADMADALAGLASGATAEPQLS